MSSLPKELEQEFDEMAESHAKYLAENVFIPAYVSAFTHGAKHMYEHLFHAAELEEANRE